MNLWHAVILGMVEGITEFLPISSTAHLMLAGRLLGLEKTSFLTTFEISIQLGAILAVVSLYWRSFFVRLEILKRITVAFLPTAVLALFFYKKIKQALDSDATALWSLFIGGILLIAFERWHREKDSAEDDLSKMSYGQAFTIGLFQSIALIPGVSRAAATIIGGLCLGFKRKTIVEFSFLLAVPTMMAATGYELLKNASVFSKDQFSALAVGGIVSFVVAILSIRLLLRFIQNHNFTWFGFYRIAIALIFWLFIVR